MFNKFLCLPIITLLSTTAMANEIQTYSQFKESVRQGKSITIVTNVNQCQSAVKKSNFEAIGYFKPTDIMVLDDHIAASDLHFTNAHPLPTYEYVDYVFTTDGYMTLTSNQLDPQTFQARAAGISMKCQLGSDVKVYAN